MFLQVLEIAGAVLVSLGTLTAVLVTLARLLERWGW